MSIKHAIEALDRVTPEEWETYITGDIKNDIPTGPCPAVARKGIKTPGRHRLVCLVSSMAELNDYDKRNVVLIAASPDMAAWIKRALPILRLSKHVHIPETRPELINDPWDAELDKLIAEATDE